MATTAPTPRRLPVRPQRTGTPAQDRSLTQGPSRRAVKRQIATMALLVGLAASLLTAVPALSSVLRTIRDVNPVWIGVALALELLSCTSFVLVFRAFFDRLDGADARPLAWANMASGALLPGGGAGGIAIGGWLIHLTGAPTAWIIKRSGGLFFLTTAVNAVAVISSGILLLAGVSAPHAFVLGGLPALLVSLATGAVLVAAHRVNQRPGAPGWVRGLSAGVRDAEATLFHQPSWRLLGALGYLGFDIAVMWVALKAVGQPLPVPALILAYNIGYLASTVPVPGGIGVLDAGLSGSLLLYGAPAGHVAAAVIIYHVIALWVPGLGGVIAYARVRPHLLGGGSEPEVDVSGDALVEPAEPVEPVEPVEPAEPVEPVEPVAFMTPEPVPAPRHVDRSQARPTPRRVRGGIHPPTPSRARRLRAPRRNRPSGRAR